MNVGYQVSEKAAFVPQPASLKDFPDFLSPILVKELRQALRGGGFTGIFCFLQAALVLLTLLYLMVGDEDANDLDEFFWGVCGLVLVVLVPMRALNTLFLEMKRDTFSLLALTRMNAWRIVFGKWMATMWLNILVTTTILPFFVFRYFRGGIDLVAELTALGVLLCAGAVVAAFTTAFSAHKPIALRGLAFLGSALGLGMLSLFVISGELDLEPEALYWIFPGAAYICFYSIAMGTGWICTEEENYAAWKRVLTFSLLVGITLALWLMDWSTSDEEPLQIYQFILSVLFLFDCVTEIPRSSRAVSTKLSKLSLLRPFRRLMYPGWQSGHVFVIPVVALFLFSILREQFEDGEFDLIGFIPSVLLMAAWFIMPTAIIQLLKGDRQRFVGRWVLLMIAMIVYSIAVCTYFFETQGYSWNQERDISLVAFLGVVASPISAFIVGMDSYQASGSMSDPSILIVGASIACVWLLLLLLRSNSVFARFRRVESAARGEQAALERSDE